MTRGFTLIEAIIYIGLLGLLMVGAVAASYEIMQGSTNTSAKAVEQDEGNFVQRKLQWALGDMSDVPTIGGSGCEQTISITKSSFSNNPVEFQRNTSVTPNVVEMREGGSGAYSAITTNNVSASCLKFVLIPPAGTGPAGITATTTINDLDFVITRYLRK